MSVATSRRFRVYPGGHHARGEVRRTNDWLLPAFVVLALAAVLIALATSNSSERTAIRGLSDDQRRASLSRTVAELRQFCGEDRASGLEGHCRELASFAARFDECRGECEALVRQELAPVPRR